MNQQDQIEMQVRARLAELLSSAGVGYDRVAVEVLYLFPPEFVRAYAELYHQALKGIGGGGVGDENSLAVKRTKKDQMPLVKGGGKKYREYWQIADDKAFT